MKTSRAAYTAMSESCRRIEVARYAHSRVRQEKKMGSRNSWGTDVLENPRVLLAPHFLTFFVIGRSMVDGFGP